MSRSKLFARVVPLCMVALWAGLVGAIEVQRYLLPEPGGHGPIRKLSEDAAAVGAKYLAIESMTFRLR
jgi:hypothetical protein